MTPDETAIRRGEIDSLAVKADAVCRAMMAIRSAESLTLALASTDVPEDVARVLLALTEWADAADLTVMEKRTITFSAKGRIFSLLTEDDTDRMKGEIFRIVADNLRAQVPSDLQGQALGAYDSGTHNAALLVEQIGAYYLAKLPTEPAPAPEPAPETKPGA